jgi:hypothetical protein
MNTIDFENYSDTAEIARAAVRDVHAADAWRDTLLARNVNVPVTTPVWRPLETGAL